MVQRPIADLIPAARNPRTHSDAQIAQIAASIREFGWTNPLLADERGTIIAGHGRLAAARQLGMQSVPVIALEHLTTAQKRALVIADNKLALNAGWDDDLLRLELGDLRDVGFDLDLLGFSDLELGDLFAEPGGGLTDPDDVPDLQEQAVTQPGDVWLLGRHRLVCGDSTDAGVVEQLMAGKLADICFTSPPYAQQRDYKSGGIADWDALMQGVFSVLPVKDDAQVLVNLGLVHRDGEWMPYWEGWIEWMRSTGWRRFGWYVWDQGFGLPGDWNGRLAPSHEFVFHFNRVAERARKSKAKQEGSIGVLKRSHTMRGKDGKLKEFSSPAAGANTHKVADSVIRVMRHQGKLPGDAGSHPAVFPVDLPSEVLTAFSDPGDIVFEPFCGSGTQIISAHSNGRACHAIELDPHYCDVAVRRWQDFTGSTATLERTGEPFPEQSVDAEA